MTLLRLHAADDVALVALYQLLEFLQTDLGIDFVILANDFDLAAGDLHADLLEIHGHRVQIRVADRGERLRKGIKHADLEWRLSLGEEGRGLHAQRGARSESRGLYEELATTVGARMRPVNDAHTSSFGMSNWPAVEPVCLTSRRCGEY